MISYNPITAKAIGYLKRQFNEVEIFVEDTACRLVWDSIVRRLLPARVKIRSLNRLGGRDNVIAACRLDQAEDGRRKIYIIDADFDHALGKRKPRLKFLYRLRGYCVENILINKKAVERVAELSDPNSDPATVHAALDFSGWEATVAKRLTPLYISYAAASKHYMLLKTVRYSVTEMIESVSGEPRLSDRKIARRTRAIWRDMRRTSTVQQIKAMRTDIQRNVSSLPSGMYISGKDGLLPMLLFRLRAAAGYRGDPDQLKALLASLFTAQCEPFLARRLASL